MTDLELTKLCAQAMEFDFAVAWPGTEHECIYYLHFEENEYWEPLRNDEQAMQLVKKLGLTVFRETDAWQCLLPVSSADPHMYVHFGEDENLNRAIVECVARMQAAIRTEQASEAAA